MRLSEARTRALDCESAILPFKPVHHYVPRKPLPEVSENRTHKVSIAYAVLDALVPWDTRTFPGRHKTILGLTGYRHMRMVILVRNGQRNPSATVLRRLEATLAKRHAHDARLLELLRAEIEAVEARPSPLATVNKGRAKRGDAP